uniref:High-potential iron-sulfur protein n=1 Tax=Thiococcus pfennigii TaxID=1057 RepID=HIP_THIPF|nr:RecName: Full=High-potential iron-sulfur protein; Short=HiPIP [Thiococcus pfennigii]
EDLPHVDAATNPIAQSLHYIEDANASERNPVTKTELPGSEQFCHNCSFIQADSGAWRPCTLYPGYTVSEDGWCLSWAHKTA